MIVQILFTCINRGEQSHSKPSIISLLSLADILLLVILHLLHLSTDTTPPSPPHQSVLHSSLPRQEAAHPGSLQVVNKRHWREVGGQEEREVGVSPLMWQELVALLGGSNSVLGIVWDPQTVHSWPSFNLHLDCWEWTLSCQHPD